MQPYKRSNRQWRSRQPRSLPPTCWRRRVYGWKKPWTACRAAAGSCASSNRCLEASACSAGRRSQPLRCWFLASAPEAGRATNTQPGGATGRSPNWLAAVEGAGKIANVSSIVREPNTENVEVHFNRLVPETAQGSLDDPQIRQLLLLGAQSQLNPGVAQNSVSLLADECLAGHQCSDGPIRKALLVALRYDKDTGVRLNALNGLKPYVAEDMRVRDGVLEALMDDPDATVRSRAIELLQPVEADSSVREVLHTVASEDDNPHIRTVSQEVLDQSPHIQ